METRSQYQTINLGFTREHFNEGTHICLIYNDDFERKKVISKYLEGGLLTGEQVYYLADETSPDEILSWLAEQGVDPDHCRIQEAEKAYCPHGYFSADEMLETIKQLYLSSHESGYPASRVTGEMTWALRGIPGSEQLMEYESRLNTVLPEYPITAICQYDAGRFDGKTIFECLRVHPYMIVKHQIVRNPYYLKPEEYLREQGT